MIDVTTLAVTVIHSLEIVAGRKYRRVTSLQLVAQQNNEKRAGEEKEKRGEENERNRRKGEEKKRGKDRLITFFLLELDIKYVSHPKSAIAGCSQNNLPRI